MSLRQDVEQTKGLESCYQPGLKALKQRDRKQIQIEHPVGSADVDTALRSNYPNAARWDYLIGQRSGAATRVHWVEVHPANGDHTIGEVAQKLQWLKTWLSGTPLRSYASRYYWVASGKCSFNGRYPKLRSLIQQGLQPPVRHLTIPAKGR
ncbi:MAG TPA: hypothetical protein VMX16_15430 [Terriglobia bacterium]|jgi:gentisate 1,2-dioxygenase|nr:hypothetical protein [Terriglobia bacterium]